MKTKIIFYLSILMLNCVQLFAQQKIYTCTYNEKIYTIDVSNCSAQLVGQSGVQLFDIAVTPNGNLWGIGGTGLPFLYSIDTLSGAATYVGVVGFSGNALVELNDSILLLAGGANLYRVNVNTGVGTFIGALGYPAGGDLTWYDNDLYMVVSALNLVIKIVLNSNATSIVSATATSVNPISTLSACYGAITSPFPSEVNAILAFKGESIYKLCPFDTVPVLLCDSIFSNLDAFYGAASHRLPVQNPLPISCDSVTSINELTLSEGFEIFPNPATNKVVVRNTRYEIKQIMIYDLTGKKVFQSFDNLKSQIDIDVSILNEGIYFLQIQTSDFIQAKKLVIAR